MRSSSNVLPPLNCLKTFEAAARCLSVTGAAEELHLTQSAVSRQIKRLEQDLGRGLFLRESAGLRLTPAGERYYEVVRRLLRELGEATVELRRAASDRQLTIAASPTIASFWLARLMAEFRARHPEIAIRLLVVEDPFSLDLAEFDLGLYTTCSTISRRPQASGWSRSSRASASPRSARRATSSRPDRSRTRAHCSRRMCCWCSKTTTTIG